MKAFILVAAMFMGINAIPTIVPSNSCGNGISCASQQTCMSNATGAGLMYACSPLPDAVRCMDARFSCPASTTCGENSSCVSLEDGGVITDVVVNVDAHEVAEMRDFGHGVRPTALSVCGPITSTFRLPNFCTCKDVKFGSELSCAIGLQTFVKLGASAWVLPCASPSSFGYKAWVVIPGVVSTSIGNTWTATFTIAQPIPGATFELGIASVGARAELSGEVSRFIISTQLAIGACAKLGVGPFSKEICNPSVLNWLPVTVVHGPHYDFSRFC